MTDDSKLTEQDLIRCAEVLEMIAETPEACLKSRTPAANVADRAALLLRRLKKARKKISRTRDQELVAAAAIRQKRTEKEYGRYLPSQEQFGVDQNRLLDRRRICYICKQPYQQLHHFYDAMCRACGDFQYLKRSQSADLTGRQVLVTGGRVKIGFQSALMLLRSGCEVLVTSRFPKDAAYRYSLEEDFSDWSDRLRIYSADFRSLASVHTMCDLIEADVKSLNGLVNNAAQTIRRPPQYYRHLLEREAGPEIRLPGPAAKMIASDTEACFFDSPLGLSALPISAAMTQVSAGESDRQLDDNAFPVGQFDNDGQQIDARDLNSWTMPLSDVGLQELLEVHAVNAFVPFVLLQRLEPLLVKSRHADRYVVNVNAMEGQLNTHMKTPRHPHTNMAKAGMNMITRTCSESFAKRGIYMNSVDTGWITNEFPLDRTAEMETEGFEPPLDEIDGAARVLDPIFQGVGHQNFIIGKFLKDYQPTAW